jgi:hypothetical protein
MPGLGSTARAGTVCSANTFCPRARANRHPVGDRVADQVVHGAARRGAELEEIILGIPHQQTLALERSADAPGQPLDQCLQLRRARRCNASEQRRLSAREIGPGC